VAWAEGGDQRLLRLQDLGDVADAISNDLLGFYADRAAFRLRSFDGITEVKFPDLDLRCSDGHRGGGSHADLHFRANPWPHHGIHRGRL
jgi:hypothetical protein